MTLFLLFSITMFVVAVVGVWVWWRRKYEIVKQELRRLQMEMEKERELFNSFDEYNRKIAQIKAERKQKIMEELAATKIMDTGKAAELLDISRATAFRYLEELEKEGDIEQVGKFGRYVKYRAKQR